MPRSAAARSIFMAATGFMALALTSLAGCAAEAGAVADSHESEVRRGDEVASTARDALSKQLKIPADKLAVESTRKARFHDACLDCAAVLETCESAEVDGYEVALTVNDDVRFDGQTFLYHLEAAGEATPRSCTPIAARGGRGKNVPGANVDRGLQAKLREDPRLVDSQLVADARLLLGITGAALVERGFKKAPAGTDNNPIYVLGAPGIYGTGQRVILAKGRPQLETTAGGVLETIEVSAQPGGFRLETHHLVD